MSVPRPRALRPYSADLRFLAGGGTMGARMRAHDWAATPLGPAEGWPQSLRSSVSTCLNCSFPILLWWGPELVKLYNDAYVPIIGDKHPDALGRPGREVWPEIWDTIGPMLRRVTEYGEAAPADDLLLLLCRHGYSEECYFSFSYSPIHDESGGVGGIFCPVLETTAKVIGARRLRTVSNLGALDRAPSADAAATACARVMAGNDADLPFALIYLLDRTAGIARLAGAAGIAPGAPGAPPEIPSDAAAPWPMVSIPADGAVIPDLRGRFAGLPYGAWTDPPEQALALPIPLPGEAESSAVLIAGLSPRKRLDDEYRAFLSLVASLIGGHIADAVALAAERRRVEALAELDQAKTTFFSNVSHEFRTPLTLMLGPLEELLSRAEQLPPADRACAEVAYRNGLRLLRLVNALLDFSRVEANRAHVRLQPTDLAALTTELASTFQSLCERGGLSLTIDCPALPEPVWVDQAMWEKVVLNLLSNAFKFTFDGGIQVLLRPSADGQAAELSVVDTGTGIPSEELPRLFERFHRIEGARGRSHEGSGIGLALVQELVRLHGGEVTVESELDQGTAFTVAVPFGAAGLPAERVGQGRTAVQSAMRAQAFVEEALRWLPDGKGTSTEADAVLPPPGRGLSDFSFPTASDRCGRVLVADDNADMRDYVSRLLAGIGCEVEAVPNGEAALAAARQRIPDLILSDVMMPGLDGVSLLRALRSEPGLAEIPFLLVSARAGEEARIEGLDAGADDYVTKPFTARELVARVGANLNLGRLRREAMARGKAELERLVEERTREHDRVWRNSRDLLVVVGADGIFRAVNPAWTTIIGHQPEEVVGRSFLEFIWPEDASLTQGALNDAAADRRLTGFENRYRSKDGSPRWISWHTSVEGDLVYAYGRDVTAGKEQAEALQQAAEALRQSQKMEAVGQLTGGIAHDFNNLLTGISGSLELVQTRMAQGRTNDLERFVTAAQGAVKRASSLTHRLLAFSRRQTLDPKPTNINRVITGMEELIRRTVGPAVAVEVVAAAGLWTTLVDQNQLENALLNLCINGRDAMPDGGGLTIETANRWLDPRSARERALEPGQYVSLCVSDTGTGMTPEVIAHAFDPFFTTKPTGMGTGLGLSMIYGFTRQSGGQVRIYSEVGQGTMVCLYLPRHHGDEEVTNLPAGPAEVLGAEQGETVLVVDDDATVRMLVTETLEDLGYIAIEAADAAAGLKILQSDGRIDLLVTDVGLPGGLNGRQLADAGQTVRPGLKVLFITGYAENAVVGNGPLEPGMHVLTKPFEMEALATRIRTIIAKS